MGRYIECLPHLQLDRYLSHHEFSPLSTLSQLIIIFPLFHFYFFCRFMSNTSFIIEVPHIVPSSIRPLLSRLRSVHVFISLSRQLIVIRRHPLQGRHRSYFDTAIPSTWCCCCFFRSLALLLIPQPHST